MNLLKKLDNQKKIVENYAGPDGNMLNDASCLGQAYITCDIREKVLIKVIAIIIQILREYLVMLLN